MRTDLQYNPKESYIHSSATLFRTTLLDIYFKSNYINKYSMYSALKQLQE